MHCSIELEDVTHGFRLGQQDITLFSNLSLRLEQGQSMAIVGPSGVGKSSLLMLMAGLESPRQGQFRYQQDLINAPPESLRRRSGFVFQQFHLLEELTALHNLALPLKLKGDHQAEQKAREWLHKVGLAERADHKPVQLSGGEQQRVAIARAYISEPAFVFADEPTGNLDQHTAQQITDLMFDCAKQLNCALVYVTHNLELAERADGCFVLNQHGLEQLPVAAMSGDAA